MIKDPLPLLLELLLCSKMHRDYPLWVVERNLMHSLSIGNFRLYIDDGFPIGFVNWTFLTKDEMNTLMKSGGIMALNFWRKEPIFGTALFIVEVINRKSLFPLIQSDLECKFPQEAFAYGLSWKNSSKPRIRKIKNRKFDLSKKEWIIGAQSLHELAH